MQYGREGDVPVAADYDGDTRAEIGVWRPSNGSWYLRGAPDTDHGSAGDVPLQKLVR